MEPQAHPRVVESLEEAMVGFKGQAVREASKEDVEKEDDKPRLSQIGVVRERKVRQKRVNDFQQVAKGFPTASEAASTSKEKIKIKRIDAPSSSLFASLMLEKVEVVPPTRKTAQATSGATDRAPSSSLPISEEALSKEIDEENRRRVGKMSEQEIREAQAQLFDRFDPSVLAALANRGSIDAKKRQVKKKKDNNVEEIDLNKNKDLGWIRTEEDLKSALKTHLPKNERAKIKWMLEDDDWEASEGGKQQNSSSKESNETEPRFDLQGAFVTPDKEFQNELYHHAGPNVPGYTVRELIHLSRSTVAQQRAIALRALAGLFRSRAENLALYSKVDCPQNEALVALRLALDQENISALPQAVEALQAFILPNIRIEQSRRQALGFGLGYFQYGVAVRAQGAPTVPPAAAREISLTVQEEKKDEVDEDGDQMSDLELAESSPVRFLVRSYLIKRMSFIITQRPMDILDDSVKRFVEVVSYIVRSRPVTASEDFDALTACLQKLLKDQRCVHSALDLFLAMIGSDEGVALKLSTSMKDLLISNIRTTSSQEQRGEQPWGILTRIVYCFRAWFVYGLEIDTFESIFPTLAGIMDDYIGEFLNGQADANNEDAIDFICVVFDLAEEYCAHKRNDPQTYRKLASFSSLATRVAASLFSVMGTRVASAAVRFLAALLTAKSPANFIEKDEEEEGEEGLESEWEYQVGMLGCLSKKRQLSSTTNNQSRKNEEDEDEYVQQMFMAIIIFAGHAAYLEEHESDELIAKVTRADGLRSALLGLIALANVSTEMKNQLVESSTVCEDIWMLVSHLYVAGPKRTLAKPPASALQGLLNMTRDDVFYLSFELARLLSDSTSPLQISTKEDLIGRLEKHIREDYGSFGIEYMDQKVVRLIGILATPALAVFPDSRTCLEIRDALLGTISSSLQDERNNNKKSLVVSRFDSVYNRWTRYAPAWPAIGLLANVNNEQQQKFTRESVQASLLFSLGLDLDFEAVASALCLLAIRAPRELLMDSDVVSTAVKWFDKSLDYSLRRKVTKVMSLPSELFLRFVGGREKARQLSHELAQKFVEDTFGNELIGRCLGFLCSPFVPSSSRIACWKVLDRGMGLRYLPQQVFPLFSENGLLNNFEETDEDLLDLFGKSLESGSIGVEDWLTFKFIRPQFQRLFATEKWIAKRLRERLQATRPDLLSLFVQTKNDLE